MLAPAGTYCCGWGIWEPVQALVTRGQRRRRGRGWAGWVERVGDAQAQERKTSVGRQSYIIICLHNLPLAVRVEEARRSELRCVTESSCAGTDTEDPAGAPMMSNHKSFNVGGYLSNAVVSAASCDVPCPSQAHKLPERPRARFGCMLSAAAIGPPHASRSVRPGQRRVWRALASVNGSRPSETSL